MLLKESRRCWIPRTVISSEKENNVPPGDCLYSTCGVGREERESAEEKWERVREEGEGEREREVRACSCVSAFPLGGTAFSCYK